MDTTTPTSPSTLSDAQKPVPATPFPTNLDRAAAAASSTAGKPADPNASGDAPAASMAERWIQRATDTAHGAVDSAAEKARSLTGGLQGGADRLGDQRDEWIESAREAIRQHPFAAIGTAVLIGLALHSLSSRAR